MKERIDLLLVRQGFFESRERAKRSIMAGVVLVNDRVVDKAGTLVDEESEIRIKGEILKYVSRGGLKLEKAIKVFQLDLNGKKVLDIGASTGGFTDCALQNGAKFVYAVDVGTNQLSWKIRQDIRVKSLENCHIKELKKEDLNGESADFIVVDVSFISLGKVILYFKEFLSETGKIMMLIKPQFEVGRENIEKGGIVKDFEKHYMAIENVIKFAEESGFYINGIDVSPITGSKGNIEYISCFSKIPGGSYNIEEVVKAGEKLKKGV
jgi:23S rRNA (cytidine1920-2'-O)/16S rRNA (cytidine1409-2'-O)-methyltransferase